MNAELAPLGDMIPDLPADVCWPWKGTISPTGYARVYDPAVGREIGAHRMVWHLTNGHIPDGFHVDHVCHDPEACQLGKSCPHRACVNPAHLNAVPAVDNILRSSGPSAQNARKTHCKRGHEFTPDNIALTGYGHGRRCRTCMVERQRIARAESGAPARLLRRTFPTKGLAS